MLVVDLHCAQGHLFEGWFASADDLASQQARGLVTCPVCGVSEVVRRPSASRLNVSNAVAPVEPHSGAPASGAQVRAAPPAPHAESLQALQAQYLRVVRQVLSSTEDVGERFVEEVRDMHRGDAPQRPVRGQADRDEVAELRQEGIDVLSMPIPDALKGPVQ